MKKFTFIVLLLCIELMAFKPAVLLQYKENSTSSGYIKLGYDAISSFKEVHKIDIDTFSVNGKSIQEKYELIINKIDEGYDPIIGLAFSLSDAMEKAAKKYPNINFVMIDDVINTNNATNLNFKEEEGSFIVGAIAALKTKTNTIGFLGGMDLPVIRRFGCGFIQGAKHINKNIKIIAAMSGKKYTDFNNEKHGRTISEYMIKKNADIIFHAAGRTGKGLISLAKEKKVFAIGVDTNQNKEAPGQILTSMLKRIEIALYNVLVDSLNKRLIHGTQRLGIKENGVGWALDEHNIKLLDKKIISRIEDIEFNIVQEMIKVEDYMQNNSCKDFDFNKSLVWIDEKQ
jgi:basic membrane protein A